MNKVYYDDATVKTWVHEIIRSMTKDGYKPDYVVGLARGGLVPALMISHYLEIPMETLKVSLRDDEGSCESNLWMAEDAYGMDNNDPRVAFKPELAKKILIVDDINDTGATLQWIKDDWQSGCLPPSDRWNEVWNKNVRFAVMINNEASKFKNVDYIGLNINKHEAPQWCVFSWEEWYRG